MGGYSPGRFIPDVAPRSAARRAVRVFGHSADHLAVVLDGRGDDARGVLVAIPAHDSDLRRLARHQLVGREVVLQPFEQRLWDVGEVPRAAPDVVAIEHRDDLVVGLAAIDDLQASENASPQQDLRVGDRPLADDTDVEWIAVTPIAVCRQETYPLTAIGLRNEAVERGRVR